MGKLDKLREAFGSSKGEEAAPPPYAPPPPEYPDSKPPQDAPEYSIPRLGPEALAGRPSSSSSQPAAGTLMFPPRISCHHKMLRTYIGVSKDNPLWTVTGPKLFGRPDSVLHTTADKESPALAFFGPLKGSKYTKSVVKVPARPGGDRAEDVEVAMTGDYANSHLFHIQVGQDRHTESFEWRNSGGKEVRDLGQSRIGKGYKLVRFTTTEQGRGGERTEREWGFTSEGEEIVAIGAHTSSWSTGPNFAFMGTGLTGAFGETWEIVAVASWLRLVQLAQEQAAAAGAAAA
jgi:hypothetical protein